MECANFFDFTDFFTLLTDSMSPSFSNEEVFEHLLAKLYRDANRNPGSLSDEVSDLLRKRKPFHTTVRRLAQLSILDDLVTDLTENSRMLKWIIQPQEFIDKVIYRVKQDDYFYNAADVEFLEANRNRLPHVVSYVLIRTVSISKETNALRHTADFNPFSEYHMPASLIETASAESSTKKLLAQTSSYMFNEFSSSRRTLPAFRSELLSHGISGNIFPGKLRFEQTFSILETSSESRPLDSYLATPNHLMIIGEGGIGKTTFLYSCLKKYHNDNTYASIPLYLKLSDCSTSTDHQYMIQNALQKTISFAVNGHEYISFKDFRDEFAKPCPENCLPEYTLLLDGFNEITPMDLGEVRRAISREIADLLTFPNLRIILTSRDNEFYHLPLARFVIIRANGIKDEDVIRYLQTVLGEHKLKEVQADTALMQYLRIPLFLLMYANSSHTEMTQPRNRGSILFSYFNSRQSFYTEKLNSEEKNTLEAYYMVSILLDFLLPDLGYYMKTRNAFQITEEQLAELTASAIHSARRFIGLNCDAYRHYEQRPGSLKRALSLFSSKLKDEDILSLLKDYLCVLSTDSNCNLSFAHQYIRDYFSALYCIREFYYMNLISEQQPHLLSDIDHSWGDFLWDDEQISLVQEILSIPSDFQTGDLIAQTMSLFRSTNHYPLPDMKYALTNLVSVLALANDGDLFRYDFSYLDLSNCTLANYNFHNFADGCSSSFHGAKIGIDTFATDAHNGTILKWEISDDGQFIISISTDFELKIWNIATQKCMVTRKLPQMEQMDKVSHLALLNRGTLALLTYQNKDHHSFASATYDFNEEIYTVYLLPHADMQNIVYFGYDNTTNTLVYILSNGYFYRYNVNDETHIDELCLSIALSSDIFYYKILSGDKLLYSQNDFLYLYHLSTGISERLGELSPTYLNRIMVSRDNTIIAAEANGRIQVCHLTQPSPALRHLATFSPEQLYAIKFCHDDPNILSFFSYDEVYHLDCITGEVLFYTPLENITTFSTYTITNNYRVIEPANTGMAELQLTNLYTKATTIFRLSNRQHLMGTYIDHESDTLHGLYNNGTLISFDADTLKLRKCFNYGPGRYVSAAVYCEQDKLLCFSSMPSHYYLNSRQSQLTLVDLSTGMCRKSAPIFEQIDHIRFVNAQQLVILSAENILLVDTQTFAIISSCPQYEKRSKTNEHIFIDGRNIHVTSDYSPVIAHIEYTATVATYIIDEQNTIALKEITPIPCPWQFIEHCPLIYSVLDHTGLSLIKAVKPSEKTYMTYHHYEYTTPGESEFRMFYEASHKYELMDNWTLASLGNSHDPLCHLSVPEDETQVFAKFFHPAGDNIIRKGDSFYEHRISTDEYIPLSSNLFTDMELLNYSSQKRIIYYNDRHSSSIHKYDIDKQRTMITSNYLHPHILIYGCDFRECTGELKGIDNV